jgi:hypothetical protein
MENLKYQFQCENKKVKQSKRENNTIEIHHG